MKFTLIRPNRADIKTQFSLVKRAFNKVHQAKYEFEDCCEKVMKKHASFYQLTGKGVSVRFVGFVTDENDYLVIALTGKGLKKAAPVIIDAVKSQGYRSIQYHTVRRGMTRILRGLGFSVLYKTEHDTVLSLDLEGC